MNKKTFFISAVIIGVVLVAQLSMGYGGPGLFSFNRNGDQTAQLADRLLNRFGSTQSPVDSYGYNYQAPSLPSAPLVQPTNNMTQTGNKTIILGDFEATGNVRAAGGTISAGKQSVRLNDNRNSLESNGGFLSFIVGNGSWPSSASIQGLWERMRILANGYVGIGIAKPLYKLHIRDGVIAIDDVVAGSLNTIGQSVGNGFAIVADSLKDGSANMLTFSTRANTGVLAARMRIDDEGNVGIDSGSGSFKNFSPAALLDVNGSFKSKEINFGGKLFRGVCPIVVSGVTLYALSETTTCGTSTPVGALTVSLDSNSPPARQLVMGSTDNVLAQFNFAPSSGSSFSITSIEVQDDLSVGGGTTATVKPSFTNLRLYRGTTLVAGPLNLVDLNSTTRKVSFFPANPIIISSNTALTLKADVATFASGGATDNKIHVFKIPDNGIGASGGSIGYNNPIGNQMTVLRSKLSLSAATLGAVSGRVRAVVDDLATITFTANPAGDVTVNKVRLSFVGRAVSGGVIVNARLIDPNTGTDWSGLRASACTTDASNSCVVTFDFTTIPTITAGTSKAIKVRVDSSGFFDGANTADSLSVLIRSKTDVDWGDGTTTSGLNLEVYLMPIIVANLSYE